MVAHAPHSGKGPEEVQHWWKQLSKLIQRSGQNRHVVAFLDANAQPLQEEPYVGQTGDMTTNFCGHAFNELLRDCDLFLLSTFCHLHNGPLETWTANSGKTASRIDFIALSLHLRNLDLSSYVDFNLDSGVSGLDHNAATLRLRGVIAAAPPKVKRPSFDHDKILHATPAQWSQFFADWPSIPWQTDPSTHAAIVEHELHQRLERVFPTTSRRKRNTLDFQPETWKLFAEKARLRRVLSAHPKGRLAMSSLRDDAQLQAVPTKLMTYALRIAFTWKTYKSKQRELQSRLQHDRALHLHGLRDQLSGATRSDVLRRLRPRQEKKGPWKTASSSRTA